MAARPMNRDYLFQISGTPLIRLLTGHKNLAECINGVAIYEGFFE